MTDERKLLSNNVNSKVKLLNLIDDLERMELLDSVNDHINHNSGQLNQERNDLVSRAINYVESELDKRITSEALDESKVPMSQNDKAAEFEYITIANMKEDELNTALKLAKLKSILEEKNLL